MIWLGIETSCDDTSIAIVNNGAEILVNLISSQTNIHSLYGGVVPEIASRKHLETINPLIEEALKRGGLSWKDIDAAAVSYGPGLTGSLLVGIAAAKTISALLDIPLVGVNHLPAHIYANFLSDETPELPALALLISGGHTCLAIMKDHCDFQLLGETRDDAVGECFDKAARIMGLPYPGGPEIDKLAKIGNRKAVAFPRPYLKEYPYEFSFSGLKTAVLQYCKQIPDFYINDACASLQEAVSDVLARKTVQALKEYNLKTLLIAGGVACNSRLRERFQEECKKRDAKLFIPPPVLCTDNAAMAACLAHYKHMKGIKSDLSLDAVPGLSWENI